MSTIASGPFILLAEGAGTESRASGIRKSSRAYAYRPDVQCCEALSDPSCSFDNCRVSGSNDGVRVCRSVEQTSTRQLISLLILV